MNPQPPNRNELEALRILWENNPLKPAQIQEQFGWPIENATLRSVLANLVEKKQIERRREGKAFFYSASVHKTAMLQGMMAMLKRAFAAGSSRALVAQLIETGDIKDSDLESLRQAASKDKKGKVL